MNITVERNRIKEEIDNISDETVLNAIKKLLGLTSEALPRLTEQDLIKRALESEKAISEGRVITIDDLEREMKNW
ncbi:MAG TPA: hypothetical protein VK174_00015 [Chitinophagales bacterium]|nr:hypothetical protein [Chitinophagales bacterium]